MFGKPEWFKEKSFGWGLVPITLAGWMYTLAWVTVMLAPFFALMLSGMWIQSMIWLGVTMAALIYDVALILRTMHATEKKKKEEAELLIIDETNADQYAATTAKHELYLR